MQRQAAAAGDGVVHVHAAVARHFREEPLHGRRGVGALAIAMRHSAQNLALRVDEVGEQQVHAVEERPRRLGAVDHVGRHDEIYVVLRQVVAAVCE